MVYLCFGVILMKEFCGSALVLASLLASTSVVAETDKTGFYVGGDIGSTNLDADDSMLGLYSVDDSAYSVGVYGGYNVNNWFGVEAHLFTTGDYSSQYFGRIELDTSATVFSVAPKFTLVFNDTFSSYVKFGLSYITTTTEAELGNNTYGDDLNGFGTVLGAGITAALTENLNLRLAYEYNSGDLELDDDSVNYDDVSTDLSQFSIGMHYQF